MIGQAEHPAAKLLPLLREFAVLDRKRTNEGVSPLEYQRWLDLRMRLDKGLGNVESPGREERQQSARVPTRIRVEFTSPGRFQQATIRNLSHGGLFIATPFAAEIGVTLVLAISILSTGQVLDLPVEVVTNNVGDGFSTAAFGMGVKFVGLSTSQKTAVHNLMLCGREEIGGDESR